VWNIGQAAYAGSSDLKKYLSSKTFTRLIIIVLRLALTNHVPAVAVKHGGQTLSSKIRRKGSLGKIQDYRSNLLY